MHKNIIEELIQYKMIIKIEYFIYLYRFCYYKVVYFYVII